MKRFFVALAALSILGACGAKSVWAPDDVVARAVYRHDGPPALTLYTMVNNRSGSGAHSSLMINASQRVVFDPAGTIRVNVMPERNDVLFGITPPVADFYERAHARSTYHVVIQRIEVPAAVAEQALQLALQNGPVASAQCTLSTSALLARLPGFESIKTVWFPNKLSEQFGQLPGVSTRVLRENDDDDKTKAVAAFQAELAAKVAQAQTQ
ncbi:hypothetical protein [Pseudoprimorskyibacter insulae]|uniref:Lipoprotein n=1 Tax=Pseudoprimorskyibacter insulae TaxID=1695997 RepID=A0A2R8ANE1_9RHOB|nr:hypothetical protein [Pseudoprimorskyibacter insulae]SPF77572.1 hypothetical protein PRI8871_00155 [Pseudoprimorskyibacter insulae]